MASFFDFTVPTELHALYPMADELQTGYDEILPEIKEKANEDPDEFGTSDEASNSSFYQCPICLKIARDPIELPCCKHWLCCTCFMAFIGDLSLLEMGQTFKCPICRREFFPGETHTDVLITRRILYSALMTSCSFKCGLTGRLKEVSKHEELDCPLRQLQCPFSSCKTVVAAKDFEKHVKTCPEKSIYCPNCTLPVKCFSFPTHNCVRDLQEAVIKLSYHWKARGDPIEAECQLGKPGQIALALRSKMKKNSAIEDYCLEFSKAPPIKPFIRTETRQAESKKRHSLHATEAMGKKFRKPLYFRQNARAEQDDDEDEEEVDDEEEEAFPFGTDLPDLAAILRQQNESTYSSSAASDSTHSLH